MRVCIINTCLIRIQESSINLRWFVLLKKDPINLIPLKCLNGIRVLLIKIHDHLMKPKLLFQTLEIWKYKYFQKCLSVVYIIPKSWKRRWKTVVRERLKNMHVLIFQDISTDHGERISILDKVRKVNDSCLSHSHY